MSTVDRTTVNHSPRGGRGIYAAASATVPGVAPGEGYHRGISTISLTSWRSRVGRARESVAQVWVAGRRVKVVPRSTLRLPP